MKAILIRLICGLAMAALASAVAAEDSAGYAVQQVDQSQSGSLTEAAGESPALTLQQLGSKLYDMARTFSGKGNLLAALVPTYITGPSSGTILGVSALAVFIIIIWIVIYSIGVVPVNAGRAFSEPLQAKLPFVYQRVQRDLNHISSSVMDAIDKYSSQQPALK